MGDAAVDERPHGRPAAAGALAADGGGGELQRDRLRALGRIWLAQGRAGHWLRGLHAGSAWNRAQGDRWADVLSG